MSGPTRLGAAIAALIGVWIVVFWVTPSADRGPTVTFGSAPEGQDKAIPTVDPMRPRIDERIGVAPPAPEPVVDPTAASPTSTGNEDQTQTVAVEPPSFFLYVLAAGDTPEKISQQFYESDRQWSAIARANPEIDFGRELPIGRVIRVPVDPGNVQGRALDAPVSPGGPGAPAGDFEYVVQDGDVLGAIAKRFYGDAQKWTLIRDANTGKINHDGTNIRPGMKIIIPRP